MNAPGQPRKSKFTFAQGMQVFLVRKILEERYTMGMHADTNTGMKFFHRWSKIVRENPGVSVVVQNPQEQAKRYADLMKPGRKAILREADVIEVKEQDEDQRQNEIAEARLDPYFELLTDQKYKRLIFLMIDEELGELMRIEYPEDATLLAKTSKAEHPKGLIFESMARELDKPPERISEDDFEKITKLDLSGLEAVDLSFLPNLHNLKDLALAGTQVVDVAPLKNLQNLRTLFLDGTKVTDISPLQNMQNLRTLELDETQVHDVASLSKLQNLEYLGLSGTQVADVSPLQNLQKLKTINLHGSRVADFSPLSNIANLKIFT